MAETMSRARRPVALRIPADALETIDHEAERRQLSRTDYMVRASTGTLDDTISDALRRIETLETEVARLTQLAYT